MQWYNAFSLKIKIKKIKIENLSFYCYPYTSNKYAKITQTGVNLSWKLRENYQKLPVI